MLEQLTERYGDDFSWYELSQYGSQAMTLLERARIEITPAHALYRKVKDFITIAKSERNDDVLFYDGNTYYIVHLTWQSGTEKYPRYKIVNEEDILDYLEKDYLLG